MSFNIIHNLGRIVVNVKNNIEKKILLRRDIKIFLRRFAKKTRKLHDFELAFNESKHYLDSAINLYGFTYKISHDSKILYRSIDCLYKSVSSGLSCLILLENSMSGNKNSIKIGFESKINIVKPIFADFRIDEKYLVLAQSLRSYVEFYHKCPVTMARHDEFILFDENYKKTVITISQLENIISEAKSFINTIDTVVRGRHVFYRKR